MRNRCRYLAFAALLLVSFDLASEEGVPPKREALSATQLSKAVQAYMTADLEKRAAILARLKGSDELTRKGDEKKWVKTICKELKKAQSIIKSKDTDLLANLDDKRRQFNKLLGIGQGAVATFKTAVGNMRVIVEGKMKKGAGALIFLHGGGNVGAAHPGKLDNEMAWGWAHIRAKKIANSSMMIIPRCINDTATNSWILPSEVQAVDEVLDRLMRAGQIDPDRVFLVGQSMGGFGVWKSAAIHGDRFAAIIDLAGSCTATNQELLNFRNLDFGIFMGKTDTRTASARKGGDALKALQAGDKEGYATFYKEYPGMGHGLKDNVYVDVDAYVKNKKRNSYPRLVIWNPQVEWKRRFYNIGIISPKKGMAVKASMGKDNHVRLTSSNVKEIALYLNQELVDFKKPVKVTLNETAVFEGMVTPRLGVMLETLGTSGDTGMYYTVRIDL